MVSDAARPGMHSGSRGELADLLRSRRDRLTPADMGLPAGTRRRTAGLRREEVAQLAGVSTTYYTFLEQGRDVRPSRQVVTALASALRLSSAERAHLFQLAGISVPEAHQIVIQPWDRSVLGAIEKAIQRSDIGLVPNVDGSVVRLNIPALTEERRREFVKVIKHKGEEHKIAIRNERRDAKELIEESAKEGDLTEDAGLDQLHLP